MRLFVSSTFPVEILYVPWAVMPSKWFSNSLANHLKYLFFEPMATDSSGVEDTRGYGGAKQGGDRKVHSEPAC